MRFLLSLLSLSALLYGENSVTEPEDWGLGMVIRGASIPYGDGVIPSDSSVTSAVPVLYFKSRYFYMDGLEGGLKYDIGDNWRVALISRLRFSDIPKEYQGSVQLSTYDFGPQLRYKVTPATFIDLEVMSHIHGHSYANLSFKGEYELGDFELKPYATIRAKSAHFNSLYYGFDEITQQKLKAGVDYSVGAEAKYHLVSNLYAIVGGDFRLLDSAAKESELVQKGYQYSAYAGLGLFKDQPKSSTKTLSNKPYIRLSHGWATHYDLDQILGGKITPESNRNQLTSIFYGHPLADRLLGLPLDIYLTPGFVLHHKSEVQNILREYDIGLKAYYTIPLPLRIRLGAAEGLSYINEVSWVEHEDVIEDGNAKDSNLLNYLDFSVGLNMGDMLFSKTLDDVWLGYNIHHRSGIFSASAQFGRVSGGSNYPSIYLQMHW